MTHTKVVVPRLPVPSPWSQPFNGPALSAPEISSHETRQNTTTFEPARAGPCCQDFTCVATPGPRSGRVGGNIAQGQPMLCIKFPTGLDWLCYGCSACQPLQSGPGARGGVSTRTPSGQVPGAARRKSQSERRGMGDYCSEMAGRV